MSAQPRSPLYRAEDLLAPEFEGRHAELYAGCVRESPPSSYGHGASSGDLVGELYRWLFSLPSARRRRWKVCVAEAGFLISRNPDTVFAPDAALVDREAHPNAKPDGFYPGAPFLAIEVRSPRNSLEELRNKAAMYLAAGSSEVWLADPAAKLLEVHRSSEPPLILQRGATYMARPPLDGLSIRVEELFE